MARIEAVAGAVAGLAGIHAVAVVLAVVVAPVPADIRVELVGALELGVEFLALAGGRALMGARFCGQALGLSGLGVGFRLSPSGVGCMLFGDGLTLTDAGDAFGRLLPDLSGLHPTAFLALTCQEQCERDEGQHHHYCNDDPDDGIHVDS